MNPYIVYMDYIEVIMLDLINVLIKPPDPVFSVASLGACPSY